MQFLFQLFSFVVSWVSAMFREIIMSSPFLRVTDIPLMPQYDCKGLVFKTASFVGV